MPDPLRILFLCSGNSCRSQMAEGWAKHLKSGVIEAYSAGIAPRGLDPLAVKAMAEAGIDISEHRSKHVRELIDTPFDCVVSVCGRATEQCPIFPGIAQVTHFGFDDPASLAETANTEEEALKIYRRIRDEIRRFVEGLPESLLGIANRVNLSRPATGAHRIADAGDVEDREACRTVVFVYTSPYDEVR